MANKLRYKENFEKNTYSLIELSTPELQEAFTTGNRYMCAINYTTPVLTNSTALSLKVLPKTKLYYVQTPRLSMFDKLIRLILLY